MIGGLADWHAVVALFRRPLGLPIPHTAIIAENQERIADNLATLIEVNFLASEPVAQKLQEADFAALVADWMGDARRPDNSEVRADPEHPLRLEIDKLFAHRWKIFEHRMNIRYC